MESTSIRIVITTELHEALKNMSDERGQPASYLVREAVAAYLERSGKRVKRVHPGWGGRREGEGED